MSILKYFKPFSKKADQLAPHLEFPDLCGSLSLEVPSSSIAAANKAFKEVEVETAAKRHYVKLTPAQRFEIS